MSKTFWLVLSAGLLAVLAEPRSASAQSYPYYPAYQLNRFYYYPYVYFPHNYWPAVSPRWPEQQGNPYMRPPAYQAWPPFRDPDYRYEHKQSLRFYRGFHFWLDQF
jgi:hypothetical protein